MQRSKARTIVIKNVYQSLINNECANTVTGQYNTDDKFVLELTNKVIDGSEELTKIIESSLKTGWTVSRLNYIDRAILMVAIYEIKYTDLDKRIIINEAVENSKVFCDDDQYKFINGVLDKVE